MGQDKLGDCGKGVFFFLRFGDDNIGVGGVSSSFASKFELWVWSFLFVRNSVYRSPMASVLGSFFVKNTKSISGRRGSFKHKSVFLGMSTPPLQVLEVEVNWDQD